MSDTRLFEGQKLPYSLICLSFHAFVQDVEKFGFLLSIVDPLKPDVFLLLTFLPRINATIYYVLSQSRSLLHELTSQSKKTELQVF